MKRPQGRNNNKINEKPQGSPFKSSNTKRRPSTNLHFSLLSCQKNLQYHKVPKIKEWSYLFMAYQEKPTSHGKNPTLQLGYTLTSHLYTANLTCTIFIFV